MELEDSFTSLLAMLNASQEVLFNSRFGVGPRGVQH
jgi:hypothetical protein